LLRLPRNGANIIDRNQGGPALSLCLIFGLSKFRESNMRSPISIAALVGSVALFSAGAQAAEPCLRIGSVYGFAAIPGNRALIVTDPLHTKFKLTLMSRCEDLDFNTTLAFKASGVTRLSCLARGDQVISPRINAPADRCVIQKVELYTSAMEKSDAAAMKK
jgi:hypothetical protein